MRGRRLGVVEEASAIQPAWKRASTSRPSGPVGVAGGGADRRAWRRPVPSSWRVSVRRSYQNSAASGSRRLGPCRARRWRRPRARTAGPAGRARTGRPGCDCIDGIDRVEQLLGVLGIARHGVARDGQRLLRRRHELDQPFGAAGAVMHHQVHGARPMRVCGRAGCRACRAPLSSVLGSRKFSVQMRRGRCARRACFWPVGHIGVRRARSARRACWAWRRPERLISVGAVGLVLGQRLLEPRLEHRRRWRSPGHRRRSAAPTAAGDLAVAVDRSRPTGSRGARRRVGRSRRSFVGVGLLAVGEQVQRRLEPRPTAAGIGGGSPWRRRSTPVVTASTHRR